MSRILSSSSLKYPPPPNSFKRPSSIAKPFLIYYNLGPSAEEMTLKKKVNKMLSHFVAPPFDYYSNSIVAGGLPVQSYMTRFTPFTSLTMRVVVFWRTSHGSCAHSAVMKSLVMTARRAMA